MLQTGNYFTINVLDQTQGVSEMLTHWSPFLPTYREMMLPTIRQLDRFNIMHQVLELRGDSEQNSLVGPLSLH